MIYLTTQEVIQLHEWIIQQSGGRPGMLDVGKVDSAVNQPRMTFDGHELYPSLAEKASALAYSLARNHGFQDALTSKKRSFFDLRPVSLGEMSLRAGFSLT